MKRAINNVGALEPRARKARVPCRIVINKLSYIVIFKYIRKEDCDVRFYRIKSDPVFGESKMIVGSGIATYNYGEDRRASCDDESLRTPAALEDTLCHPVGRGNLRVGAVEPVSYTHLRAHET